MKDMLHIEWGDFSLKAIMQSKTMKLLIVAIVIAFGLWLAAKRLNSNQSAASVPNGSATQPMQAPP